MAGGRLCLGLGDRQFGNAQLLRIDLALDHVVAADRGAARRSPRVTGIEDDPYEGALGADGIEVGADLVVDQRVGNALRAVRPHIGVGGQEHLVEPVRLGRRMDRRLLGAVTGKVDIDEVAWLRLSRNPGKGGLDVGMRRLALRIRHIGGQQRYVLPLEADRRAVLQIIARQLHVVGRPHQVRPAQVLVFGDADQQRIIGARHGRRDRRQSRGKPKRKAGDDAAPKVAFRHR